MALALNNLKRVDMPLNKETKPNQPNQTFYDTEDSKRVRENLTKFALFFFFF